MELRTEAILQEKFPETCHGSCAFDTFRCTLVHGSASFVEEISSPENFLRYIPAATWLRTYLCSDWKQSLSKDISAGLVIGIMLIPQAMAYSMIASLPPHFGFYSSIVPSLIYMLLGSSKHVQLGVNAPISLMVAVSIQSSGAVTEDERINAAITITTLGGFAYFIMMIFRLDLVSTFIPDPVMSGFCTAMAFQIMSTNLKYAVGVNLNTVRSHHSPTLPSPLALEYFRLSTRNASPSPPEQSNIDHITSPNATSAAGRITSWRR